MKYSQALLFPLAAGSFNGKRKYKNCGAYNFALHLPEIPNPKSQIGLFTPTQKSHYP